MKGWSGRCRRGPVPVPVTPMATARTWVSLAAGRDRGAGAHRRRTIRWRRGNREFEGFRRASVSHRQPVEDIRQFAGIRDGVSRLAMQLQAFQPQARQIPARRFPIHF